jgi:hypothetical protein
LLGGCGEAAARPCDADLLLSSMAHGEDNALGIILSRRGAGQHQGASAVLLGLVMELGRHEMDLVAVASFKVSDGSVWCSKGSPGRSIYRE